MARKPRPKLKTPAARSSATPQSHLPGLSQVAHDAILTHLLRYLAEHKPARDDRVQRYTRVLTELAVQQVISSDDFKSYEQSSSPAIRNIRYPKTYGHLRDLTVNVMNTLFPMRQMYGSIADTPDNQQLTTAFLAEMNRQAKAFKHYSSYYDVIFEGFAFNAGIARVDWRQIRAFQSERASASGEARLRTILEGNEIRHLDPLNCFWDDRIPSREFNTSADFFAYVEQVGYRELHRRAQRGEIVLPEAISKSLRRIDTPKGVIQSASSSSASGTHYYSQLKTYLDSSFSQTSGLYADRPIALLEPIISATSDHSYHDANGVFSMERYAIDATAAHMRKQTRRTGDNELLHILISIVPSEWDLGTSKFETIYEFVILNGEFILAAQPVGEAHGLMPITIASPANELGHGSTPSVAAILAPYQYMTNGLIGIYTSQALDDAFNGILAYDANKVNMAKATKDRSGRLAVSRDNPDNDNIPLSNYFAQLRGAPANSSLLNAEAMLRERVNDFLPVASANQLSMLNRPVTHQSRQLAQVMNLHTQVASRIISEQLVQPANYIQARNIILYADTIPAVNEDGAAINIDPAQFEQVDLSVMSSDGMRGLDTIAVIDRFDKLINSIYQSPELRQDFDITKLASYLFQLEGVNIDVDSFRHPDPFSALPPEAKQMAYQLLVAAQEEAAGENATS